jgi:predicted secreted protein
MSTTVAQQRQALLGAYPLSKAWKLKVKNMLDDQVTAIYRRLQTQGRIK